MNTVFFPPSKFLCLGALLLLLTGCAASTPSDPKDIDPTAHSVLAEVSAAPIAPFGSQMRAPVIRSGSRTAGQAKPSRTTHQKPVRLQRSDVRPWPARAPLDPDPTQPQVNSPETTSEIPQKMAPQEKGHLSGKSKNNRKSSSKPKPISVENLRLRNQLPYEDYFGLVPHLNGVASWYGPTFHGKPTASGEIYNQQGMTAAHLVLPMHTVVRVKNLENGKEVQVRINDRGPYMKGRILDLSRAAAQRLGSLQKGTTKVKITVVQWPPGMNPAEGLKPYSQYVVQLAAYQSAQTAVTQRDNLMAKFNNLSLAIERTPKGRFALYAGPYDQEHEAQKVSQSLKQSGLGTLVRSYRK